MNTQRNKRADRQRRARYQRDEAPRYEPYAPVYGEGGSSWAEEAPRRKKGGVMVAATVILLCALLLTAGGYLLARAYAPYPAFQQKQAVMARDVFFNNIYVDGVPLAGMTRADAERMLSQNEAYHNQFFTITVEVDGYKWQITQNEVPLVRNTGDVLDAAFAIGRQGSPVTLGTDVTPFELRYRHMLQVQSAGAYLYTEVTYDKEAVRALVETIRARIDREPVSAMIATFDYGARTFTFTDDVQGAKLDADALYQQIIACLDQKNYQATVTAQSEPVVPAVTRAALMSSFSKVSSFTTSTTSNGNRNTNIDLAARAISGTTVMPGETFSFNETTGQRTVKKGYLPAPAIAGGTTVDDIGGGVCQVSSTLFNAVAMADLEIVYRSPHAWPSDYVDKGRDATVDWPNLDFKFRNNKDTPVFIVAYYGSRKVTVELYGMSLGPGESIDLAPVLISTTKPPSEPTYQQNPELPSGTQQVLKKARTGYVVETYRVYKRNGVEYRRELLCKSTYRMIQQVIEWN